MPRKKKPYMSAESLMKNDRIKAAKRRKQRAKGYKKKHQRRWN